MKYDLHREIYALTNGVDTEFFHKTEQAGGRFRIFFIFLWIKGRDIRGASDSQKRNRGFSGNGKKDARHYFSMVWGREQCIDSGRDQKGCGREAGKCDLCRFPTVRDPAGCVLWCGCICFFSYEETEGIVVLEALSCEIPVIVRDIPVYEGWLTDGEQVRKASNLDSYEQAVRDILYEEPLEKVRRRIRAGRALAEEHSMRATGEKLYQIEQKLL